MFAEAAVRKLSVPVVRSRWWLWEWLLVMAWFIPQSFLDGALGGSIRRPSDGGRLLFVALVWADESTAAAVSFGLSVFPAGRFPWLSGEWPAENGELYVIIASFC